MSMKFDPNPGIYSDSIFSLLLYFNIDDANSLEPFINPKKRIADIRFYRECLEKFNVPAEEMAPLFTVYHTQSFAFSKMYDFMSREQDFSLEALRRFLPDAKTMLTEVLDFYLPDEIDDEQPALEALPSLIGMIDTTPLVKYHLLAMSMGPERYYTILFDLLEKRMEQMKAYHKAHKATLDALKKAVSESEIRAFLESRYTMNGQTLPEDTMYSLTLVGKNAVRFVGGEQGFLILGFDYSARMAAMLGEAVKPDIVKMGKALSEEKRVLALHIMIKQGEVTAQQLLKALDLSMTATHYHLEMLQQAGMLSTRNEGRTIFYSVNRTYFDRAPMVFDPFNSAAADENAV